VWDATAQAVHDSAVATTAATNAALAATTTTKLKPEQPTAFDGNQQRVTAFLTELQFYFATIKQSEDESMIAYALSKIKGGKNDIATRWADQQRISILHGTKQNPVIKHFANYETFEQAVMDYFALRDTTGDAIEAITLLTQGDKNADEYLTMFKSYTDASGYNEPALLNEYKRGLNSGLRTKVMNTWPTPKSLEDWQTRSCEIDRSWRIEQRNTSRKNPNTNQRGSTQRFTQANDYRTPTSVKDPNAMDIDRNRRSGFSRNPNITCYHCQQKGHIANNCPDKDKPRVPSRGRNIRTMYAEMTDEDKEFFKKEMGF
jgi:hypothetical protein